MASLRYALIKGEAPALVPVTRSCESHTYKLVAGEGGPSGQLQAKVRDGNDLFGIVRVPRDLGPLADLGLRELEKTNTKPSVVHVGEDWDAFLGPIEVHNPVLEAIEKIAERGVRVHLRTRAALNRSVAERLANVAKYVTVEMPFVSMRPDITAIWEPGAATPGERLRAIRRLTSRGVAVIGRVDPLLPLINDTQMDIEEFCVAFAGTGVRRVTVSYFQLTPDITKALSASLSRMHRDILKGCFESQAWVKDENGKDHKVLPDTLREKGLKRFVEVAQRHGLIAKTCSCSDGDIMAGGCLWPVQRAGTMANPAKPENDKNTSQLDFFGVRALASG